MTRPALHHPTGALLLPLLCLLCCVSGCVQRAATSGPPPTRTAVVRIQAPSWHITRVHQALEVRLRRELLAQSLASPVQPSQEPDWWLEGEILEGSQTVNAFTWVLRRGRSGEVLTSGTYRDYYGVMAPELTDRILTQIHREVLHTAPPPAPPSPATPDPQAPPGPDAPQRSAPAQAAP